MRNLILFFFLTSTLVNASLSRWTSDQVDPDSLNEKTRPILIEKLLGRLKSGDPEEAGRAEALLVSIGHPETIKISVGRMIQGERNTPLEHFGTGAAIPYLLNGIEVASPDVPKVTSEAGIRFLSNRGRIVAALLNVVEYTETSFPPETKEWAGHMKRHLGGPSEGAAIDLLKQWWENNKTAINEKRYADAVSLPMYKGKPSYRGAEEIEERKADQDRERLARRSSHEPTASSSNESTKTKVTTPQMLWISLGILAIFTVGLIGWKTKR